MEFPTENGDSRSPPSHPLTVDLQKVNSKIKVILYSHLFPNTSSLIIIGVPVYLTNHPSIALWLVDQFRFTKLDALKI